AASMTASPIVLTSSVPVPSMAVVAMPVNMSIRSTAARSPWGSVRAVNPARSTKAIVRSVLIAGWPDARCAVPDRAMPHTVHPHDTRCCSFSAESGDGAEGCGVDLDGGEPGGVEPVCEFSGCEQSVRRTVYEVHDARGPAV